jgi:hypothetical protein
MAKRSLKKYDPAMSAGAFFTEQCIDPKTYEFDSSYRPWREGQPIESIHTIPDLVRALESKEHGKKIQVEAKVFFVENGEANLKKITNKEKFLETYKGNKKRTFREGIDSFQFDGDIAPGSVGQHDYTPLLGGPFNKQLYYTDYLRMHAACFYARNHDPVARRLAETVVNFTLGRGYRADCDDAEALAMWEAFEEVNDIETLMEHVAREISDYGEIMIHWLPNFEKYNYYKVPELEIQRGSIPRIRLVDPSTCWEIITYPEDITNVIAYQLVFPTQWQMYTTDGIPGTKFIMEQLPASDVMHFKINCVSNEKRGRSDLFPSLGYLKRLRDSVNYAVIGAQKASAWSIDTTVDGNQTDINNYIKHIRSMGKMPPPGSEFVHSKKIQRTYMGNSQSKSATDEVYEWCLSMACMGHGVPFNYLGTHLANTGTKASAFTATEPVAKMFESRQQLYQKILRKISRRYLDMCGKKGVEIEFSFPEIITQDRSAKFQDMALAQLQGWIKAEKLSPIAAKELDIGDFIQDQDSGPSQPAEPQPSVSATPLSQNKLSTEPSGNTSAQKAAAKNDQS